MKFNKKYLTFGLIFIVLFVVSIQITTFTDLLTEENLTFTTDENITRTLEIFKDAEVSSAFINLSGFFFFFNEESNLTSPDESVAAGNTMTALPTADAIYTGFNNNKNITRVNAEFCHNDVASSFSWNVSINGLECDSGTRDDIIHLGALSCGAGHNYVINASCNSAINGRNISVKVIPTSFLRVGISLTNDNWTTNTSKILFIRNFNVTEALNFSSSENISLDLNNTQIFNHDGEFSITNKTDNFSSTLNLALNNGACDCNGCEISGNNCLINFTFHSDTAGILEYSNINISFTESINPQITIVSPPGSLELDTTIDYNFTITDNFNLSICFYNVTRGASTEIANTLFDCETENTGDFSVSSRLTTYVLNVFANDTSGNVNTTNISFSVAGAAGGGVSGGGSGGIVVIGGGANWTMSTEGGDSSYQINMVAGSTRSKGLKFKNQGDSSRTITLTCEQISGKEDLCKYLTFEEESFTLPLIKDFVTIIDFEIKIPENIKQDLFANIVATDDLGNSGIISVETNVETFNFLIEIGTKLISSKNFNGTAIPYILISFVTSLISFFLFNLVFLSGIKKGRGGISFTISFMLGLLILLVL